MSMKFVLKIIKAIKCYARNVTLELLPKIQFQNQTLQIHLTHKSSSEILGSPS